MSAQVELDGGAVALRGTVVLARYDERSGRTVLTRLVAGHARRIRGVRPLINYNV